MKKIIFVLLAGLLLPLNNVEAKSYLDSQLKDVKNNTKYSQADYYKNKMQVSNSVNKSSPEIKDPGLVDLPVGKKISKEAFNAKMAKDNQIYNKIKPTGNRDTDWHYYRLYRIAEPILRANNLAYTSWRISLQRDNENINAYASNGNLISITTSLYDMIGDNDDALAFVIAHEMGHQILGHGQRTIELIRTYNRLASMNANSSAAAVAIARMLKIKKELRTMEYMADTEAITLMIKAGFSPEKGLDALTMLDALPSIRSIWNDHPDTADRIESYKQNLALAGSNWTSIGMENLYNNPVLDITKSSSRTAIVINKAAGDVVYTPETYRERLTRFAYMSYKNGKMDDAIKYFKMLADANPDDYVPYLYISYANEYLYKQTSDVKYLKFAKKSAEKAKAKNSTNKYIQEQIDNL